jgi:ankyrin repeat protein
VFPDPQSALPLPPQPNLERYKKLAKELAQACKSQSGSQDSTAIHDWANAWVRTLVKLSNLQITPGLPVQIDRWVDEVAGFAQRQFAAGKRACALSDAQFVIARSQGFASWPKFAAHMEKLAVHSSAGARFEAAADAIVAGDAAALRKLLKLDQNLVHARSEREHGATLLHYVSANGVEGYRQKTPQNIVEIAHLLLEAGADVNAECDVYGGGATTLGLTATSVHPERAGVQEALLQLLLNHGARLERPRESIIRDCVANGRLRAARFLAGRGARVDLLAAAALGRLELVTKALGQERNPAKAVCGEEWNTAFRYACMYGASEVVEFLVKSGVDLAGHSGDGQTGLHYACIGGQVEIVRLLLRRKPPLELKNKYGGTVLGQTLWSAAHGGDPATYTAIIEALLEAGAKLSERHPPINPPIDELLLRHGSRPDPALGWFGEKPQQRSG